MPKTKSDQSGKSSLLTRLSDGAYRFFYTVGAQAARRFARLRRAVRRQCAQTARTNIAKQIRIPNMTRRFFRSGQAAAGAY